MTTPTDATPKTFDLKHPFQARGGQTYTSFTARDPKARDLKKFMKLSGDDETGALQAVLAEIVAKPSWIPGPATWLTRLHGSGAFVS